MSRTVARWLTAATLIGVMLGGAYLIVGRNNAEMHGAGGAPPSGVMH